MNTKEYIAEAIRQGEQELIAVNKARQERGYKLIEPNTDTAYNDAYIKANHKIAQDYTLIPDELKQILNSEDYNRLKYNADKEKYIINALNLGSLSHYEEKVLSAVVYYHNRRQEDIKKEQERLKREELAKSKGYVKTPYMIIKGHAEFMNKDELNEYEERIKAQQKALDQAD